MADSDYGLTLTGFVPKTLPILVAETNAALQTAFGTSIDTSSGSLLGQLVGIFCERWALLWELAEKCNAQFDPDAAIASFLRALAALTGTLPNGPTASTVVEDFTGVVGTVITVGTRVATASTAVAFATLATGTIATTAAWALTHAYNVGDVVHNPAGTVYRCVTSGTSNSSFAPTSLGTPASPVSDNTVRWASLGPTASGPGLLTTTMACAFTGPTPALGYDLTSILTPISGLTAAQNMNDAAVGRNDETDAALRVRRQLELAQAGTGTQDAIRAALLEVSNVTSVTVFMNTTDATDVNGIPPHAVECLVQGGLDQDVLNALHANVPVGIVTQGTGGGAVTGTVVNSAGTSLTYGFTRPTQKPIYIIANITTDATIYVDDAGVAVEAAIVKWGAGVKCGRDAVASQISAQAFTVPGLLDCTILLDFNPTPTTSTTLAIALRELAIYSTTTTLVNNTPGTP